MTKIEKIKLLIEALEADIKTAKSVGFKGQARLIRAEIRGLESALKILKEPSNTQMQIDAKPCAYCEADKEYLDGFSYCPECGRALHD